jgi:hypothetical protein
MTQPAIPVPFPEPTAPAGSRAEVFLRYLDYFRSRLASKLETLPAAELRRSALPSGWTPLELVKHLRYVELRWLEWGFEGREFADPWADSTGGRWALGPGETLPGLLVGLTDQAARTRAIVESHDLNEVGKPGDRWDGADPATLERVLFHLLQEYARHLGQLDVVVELATGLAGELFSAERTAVRAVRLRSEIPGGKLHRPVPGRDEQELAELDYLPHRVLTGLRLGEQGAGTLDRVDQQEDRNPAPGITGRLPVVPLPSPGPIAGDYLEREGALRGREFPRVTVDEMLGPPREIGHVLGLVVLDQQRGVLEEVVDTVPRERPAYREDDLRVTPPRGGSVHDDFPLDHLGVDVIGKQLDYVVRSPHVIKNRRAPAGLLLRLKGRGLRRCGQPDRVPQTGRPAGEPDPVRRARAAERIRPPGACRGADAPPGRVPRGRIRPHAAHQSRCSHLRGTSGFRGNFGQPQLPGSTTEAGSSAVISGSRNRQAIRRPGRWPMGPAGRPGHAALTIQFSVATRINLQGRIHHAKFRMAEYGRLVQVLAAT